MWVPINTSSCKYCQWQLPKRVAQCIACFCSAYSVETSDGKKHEEQGQLENAGAENEAIAVRGSYSYTAPDGQVYTVNYIADVNGFQPEGAHLPNVPSN